jgi:PBP1b-binding outer membrane lipoprotein LpoB
MKKIKYTVSLILVLSLSLVFIGCASAPEAEQKAAEAARDAAVKAGADKYAVADLQAAKKLLETSAAQVKEKKYKEAKQGYVDAKAAFDKAAAAVAAGKKAAAEEANSALAALEEGWKGIEASVKKIEKKLKDKKDAWEADTKSFVDGLKASKEMIAADPLGAKTKVGELKAVVEKWDAAFKEMTVTPAKPETKKK